MKFLLACVGPILLGLVACSTSNITSEDDGFNPLEQPGNHRRPATAQANGFSAGQFVQAAVDNTAFFKSNPDSSANADKLLRQGTSMKVISSDSTNAKVELDSGEIGYVPTVMLFNPNSAPQPTETITPGYPPLPNNGNSNGEPLPVIDPSEQPPNNASPTIADPSAQKIRIPVPPVTAPTQ
ncbi:MAG: hypothetical protein ORN51_08140 [Akkermansiaceae bacterium]|jgi:hypothetical protein|nr:hypothetical protein [Akkermansiaceae bacterium]